MEPTYTDTVKTYPAPLRAISVTIKAAGSSPVTFPVSGGKFQLDATGLPAGEYAVFFYGEPGDVVKRESVQIFQNIATASADYDPRTPARKALDAINAVLADRAAAPNGKVKVGDKEIEYASLADLISLRNFYKKEVRREEGKSATLNHEILVYKGA